MGDTTRRRVLTSMLAAPVLAGLAPVLCAAGEDDRLIASAAEALDVFDFERLARTKLPPAHWGYLKTGVDGSATLRANAVGIGRPYIWGLASFRQEGVERVLDILQSELAGNMRQAGTRSLAEINASHIVERRGV